MVIPEYVAKSWWERILYNQSARRLRAMLLGRPHTVVVNVPYRREDPEAFEQALPGASAGRGPAAEGCRHSVVAAAGAQAGGIVTGATAP